jgi:F0F1-type ATP synthase membrane subunit b/b'
MPIIEAIKKAEQEAEQIRLQASEEADQIIETAKATATQETKRLEQAFQLELQAKTEQLEEQIKHDQILMQALWGRKDEKIKHKAEQKMSDAVAMILSKVDSL